MSHSIAIAHYKFGHRFRNTLLALIIAALAFATVTVTVDVVRGGIGKQGAAPEAVAEYPARELPAKWRWERKAVEYEHMYRHKASPRLDWIRDGGRR